VSPHSDAHPHAYTYRDGHCDSHAYVVEQFIGLAECVFVLHRSGRYNDGNVLRGSTQHPGHAPLHFRTHPSNDMPQPSSKGIIGSTHSHPVSLKPYRHIQRMLGGNCHG